MYRFYRVFLEYFLVVNSITIRRLNSYRENGCSLFCLKFFFIFIYFSLIFHEIILITLVQSTSSTIHSQQKLGLSPSQQTLKAFKLNEHYYRWSTNRNIWIINNFSNYQGYFKNDNSFPLHEKMTKKI